MSCVFCAIVAGEAPAQIVASWVDAIAIIPLNPVVIGHRIVLPRVHVLDAADDPIVTAVTVARAADLAGSSEESFNLITSAGRDATQTVMHLHWHIVPRVAGDGLSLPWSVA